MNRSFIFFGLLFIWFQLFFLGANHTVKADSREILEEELVLKDSLTEIQKEALILAETLDDLNEVTDSFLLTDMAASLRAFANDKVFKAERGKIVLRERLDNPETVEQFKIFNQMILQEDKGLMEQLIGTPIFEDLADIVYEFGTDEVEGKTISETFGSYLEDGAILISQSEDKFQFPIDYVSDSSWTDVINQEMVLYNNAEIVYGSKVLKASEIRVNFATNTVTALGIPDSTGVLVGQPVFKDGPAVYNAREMIYNLQTEKGLIRGIVTEEGDGIVQSRLMKKTPGESIYMGGNIYTTCNLEHPHYAIRARKMKLVPQKHIVSGPFNFELNEISLPLGFVYGLFPSQRNPSSGFIMPSYGESSDRGFYLRDGGFYFSISDYAAVQLLGEIYTLGGWGLRSRIDYRKRYAFNGNFDLNYRKVVAMADDGSDDITNDYRLAWTHSMDSKNSFSFSASVNLASTDYNRNNLANSNDYLSSTSNSNVRFSKTFQGTPFSTTGSVRLNQNLVNGIETLQGDLGLNMTRVQPFKGKSNKKDPISQLSISYTGSLQGEMTNDTTRFENFPFDVVNNRTEPIVEYDSLNRPPSLIENLGFYSNFINYGVQHNIPISTNFTLLKYFNFTPSFTYREVWSPERFEYTYNEEENAVEVEKFNEFTRQYEYSTAIGSTTRMYAFYNFKGGSTLRHQMTPSLSFSYRPNFADSQFGYYENVQTDPDGTTREVSTIQGSTFNSPGAGENASLSFSLGNQFELKVRDKNYTGEEGQDKFKKVKILNSLSLSGSYNFLADSLNLSTIRVSGNTTLFKNISLNFGATLDPYAYDALETDPGTGEVTRQNRTGTFLWDAEGRLVDLTNANLSISANFSPKGSKEKKESKVEQYQPKNDLEAAIKDDILRNPDLYMDFSVPWSLNLSYNLNYTQRGFEERTITQSLTFRGELGLTEKWRVNYSSGYDFTRGDFSYTTIDLSRDLHCWQMSFNWIPFGERQSYNFTIAVKSSMLSDLKIEKRDSWYDRTR
ncbi:putative LPS assembly protein LptD [Sediminitomix flava]|uniref:Lipopolysaccharide assembly outer membrane protein LptD (OstA) n=1 Tax=Sediminitomix flava TaxID=379075 RepID=A0A315ZC74_SEDFL|nr:putative LPS assembly protein LptD [Sediminitomix flava]PWJ42719.1 lipopolysaccharide assembly outer membrane protein LptD (OstA) [Sediminitomix flava]